LFVNSPELEEPYKTFTSPKLLPYAACCPLGLFPEIVRGMVMTHLMAFSIVGLMAILTLLWCLWGFSREQRHPRKTVGLLVRAFSRDRDESPVRGTRRKAGDLVELPSLRSRVVTGVAGRSGPALGQTTSFVALAIPQEIPQDEVRRLNCVLAGIEREPQEKEVTHPGKPGRDHRIN